MHPCLLSILLSVLLGWLILTIIIRKARVNLPPGPVGLPIIGHLHLLGTKPVRSLSELTRTFGSLMFLRFGSVPVLVASSPAAAQLILKMRYNIFCSPTIPVVSFVGKEPLSAYFNFHRRIGASELFSTKRLHFFQPIVIHEIRGLLQAVADNGARVQIRTELYDATFSIISRIAISRRAKDLWSPSENGRSSSLQNLLIERINLLGRQNIGDTDPCQAWMSMRGRGKRAMAISTKINAVWQQIIDERRRTRLSRGSEIKDADFLDVLLTASTQDGVQISDTAIMAVLTIMFDAGIEAFALTVEWALAELLEHPRILQKAQQELEAVVGSTRLVQESDILHLPYLRAILKETMRLHPIAPLLMPYTVLKNYKVCGFDIPRSTVACINVWAIGRDSKVWKDPLRFYPERFMDSNMDARRQAFELLPLGSGRRACPGLPLRLSDVHLILSNLLNAFEWRRIGEIDLSEEFGTLMSLKNHLVAKATLKIPRHLIDGSQPA
ncbi:hypothetical protein KP509_19G067800 [Ceratopteris richardii]|uniref:Cytochrome P450 n=1 Tax=Ceratopteris richardii TaxID=49495 RepID=A0A8T2SLZ2_CERRI|nr:hypothetical protein KP509_19G067800 [Ceratopteris richardii]